MRRKNRMKKKRNRRLELMVVLWFFALLFSVMIGYLLYFQLAQRESVLNRSYNTRLGLYAEHVRRGEIRTADGELLAETLTDSEGNETREYPYGRMFAHVIGYTSNGGAGVEASCGLTLLRTHTPFRSRVSNAVNGEKNEGDTVVTTLNYRLQQAAFEALGEDDGAVVVLEVSTGKVLAMVSKPDFDPNTISDEWDSIISDDSSSVLLNRVTSGLYPPGSIFKIFTTLEYVHEHPDYDSYSFTCSGTMEAAGSTIHCYHNQVHGIQNLTESFANSCNSSFANIGLTLDEKQFTELCDQMLFNQNLPGTLCRKQSRFSLTDKNDTAKVMQTAIGQGDTVVTPLHMAIVAAAIDHDGMVMTPYVVDHTEDEDGTILKSTHSQEYQTILTASDVSLLQQLMHEAVNNGTASKLAGQSYDAAGKTGSAEYNSSGDSHGWFVGYASQEGYEDIAVAVIVEGGGSGSQSAVPIAKQVFDVYFQQ